MHIVLCQGWLGWAWAVVVSSFTGTGCAYLERDLAGWLGGGELT
jgi:hypothetical protein